MKNIEYKDKLADAQFLEWLMATALTIDKIDYVLLNKKVEMKVLKD